MAAPNENLKVDKFEDLLHHSRPTYRELAAMFLGGAALSINEVAELSCLGIGTLRTGVREFKMAKLIHIDSWVRPPDRPTVLYARYKLGDKKDAVKPLWGVKSKSKIEKPQERSHNPESAMCQELARMLVPKRTPEQQHKVNILYLNWISGGVYG